jgi:hypothetical protein
VALPLADDIGDGIGMAMAALCSSTVTDSTIA